MGEWSDEFIPDIDLIVLRNGRLADFKRICSEMGLKLVDKRAPSLLLLTKSGIELVLARTEKPQGKEFRRWLVSEAIPGYEAARRGEALPGAEAPQLDGQAAAPPNPPVARRARGRRPASSYGNARDLLELLDRLHRARVLDPGTWHALRALGEKLDARPTSVAGVLPEAAARLLLTASASGSLEAQLDQVMGTPPTDRIEHIHYDTGREGLQTAAKAWARSARGEQSGLLNHQRWQGVVVWVGWIHQRRHAVETFSTALGRVEALVDELFGPMPSAQFGGR